jgi:hypothetical protein
MKTFVALAVSIVSVSILFCPVVIAAPAMPNDVQMVEPDPSLPKGIVAFWGRWDGGAAFLIIEKIDQEKASIYGWTSAIPGKPAGWSRWEAKVIKEYGKYKLWFRADLGPELGTMNVEYTLKGKYLNSYSDKGVGRQFTRVP